MKDLEYEPFSFLSLLEADDDEGAGGDEATGDTAPDEDGEDAGADDTADAPDDDEDFDIDTSVPDVNEDTDAGGGNDNNDSGSDSSTGSGDGGDTASTTDGDEEANEDNTELFDSLTAEEQAVKIKELKSLYAQLYSNTSDLLDRINNIECDEDTLPIFTRILNTITELKNQIKDYFNSNFSYASYYENDVMYNRFLLQIKGVAEVVEDLASSIEKNQGKKDTKR